VIVALSFLMTQGPDQFGLQHARATFSRATLFLGNGLSTAGAGPITGPLRNKVIGNSLRELDRFLNLLIDQIAAMVLPEEAGPGFERQRNTANKYRTLRAALVLPSPDHDRLRAIGRSRDCLFHCGGIVRRGDRRGDTAMTAGWARADSRRGGRVSIGDRLIIDAADLTALCRFYDALAGDLLTALAAHRRID
jgi:hypothetical protein